MLRRRQNERRRRGKMTRDRQESGSGRGSEGEGNGEREAQAEAKSTSGAGCNDSGAAPAPAPAGAPSWIGALLRHLRRAIGAAGASVRGLSARMISRQPLQMLPVTLGAAGALLFIAFLMTFYNNLFIREWPSGVAYSVLISETLPWLEASVILFALTLATLHVNRNRLFFAIIGALVSAYGIWSTVQFSSLSAGTFEAWAQTLFIRIVVPISIGALMIAVIPFVEETSRIERTMTSLSSSLTNLEAIVASMEALSSKLESVNSIKEPLKDVGALREQIQSLGEQVRGLRSSALSYGAAPALGAGAGTGAAQAAGQGAGGAAWSGATTITLPKAAKKLAPAPSPARAPEPHAEAQEAGSGDAPDAAKDNPWAAILSDRKEEKPQ
jgi:hypothetical protein